MDDVEGRARWFTLSDDIAGPEFAVSCAAVLAVLRDQIDYFAIDAISDTPWPSDVQWAVDALNARIEAEPPRRWLFGLLAYESGITAELNVADPQDFSIAVAAVPFSTGAEGWAARELVYSVSDTGTSAAFMLTASERDRVEAELARTGHASTNLQPLRHR